MVAGRCGTEAAVLEFERWFEGSRVVDEGGRPKVMYHGTDAEEDFAEFAVTEDVGFHFGSPGAANARLLQIRAFEHARIIPVFLSIRAPLRLPDLACWEPGDVVVALAEAGILSNRGVRECRDAGFFGETEFRRALEKKGYDGVVYLNSTEGGGDSFIALRSEQIRSALCPLATLRRRSATPRSVLRQAPVERWFDPCLP